MISRFRSGLLVTQASHSLARLHVFSCSTTPTDDFRRANRSLTGDHARLSGLLLKNADRTNDTQRVSPIDSTGILPVPKASFACDRVPLSRDRDRVLPQEPGTRVFFFPKSLTSGNRPGRPHLQQKPGPQFFFFDNRRLLGAAPHRTTKCHKSLVRSFASLPKCIHLALVDHRLCADSEQHPEGSALDFRGATSLCHWRSALADWLRPFPSCGTCVFSEPGMLAPADFSNTM